MYANNDAYQQQTNPYNNNPNMAAGGYAPNPYNNNVSIHLYRPLPQLLPPRKARQLSTM